MLDLQIITEGSAIPVFDLPAVLGRHQAAREIGEQVDSLIAFLDDLQGDIDLEDSDGDLGADDSGEPDDDTTDVAWIEWGSRGRHKLQYDGEVMARGAAGNLEEDDEAYGDEADASFPEWRADGLQRPVFIKDHSAALGMEDAEDPDNDRCVAGDDHIIGGPVAQVDLWRHAYRRGGSIGSDDDAEARHGPTWAIHARAADDDAEASS